MVKIGGYTKERWSLEEIEFLKDNYGSFKSHLPPVELSHRSSKAIRAKASQLGLRCKDNDEFSNWATYRCDDFFFNVPNKLNSYWAGFLAADGNVDSKSRLRVCLNAKDQQHLENLRNDLQFTGPIRTHTNNTGYKKSRMSVLEVCCSGQLIDDLACNFGVTPNKTLTLLPPHDLSRLNSFAFCLGLVDGDGSVYSSSGRLYIELLGTEGIVCFARSVFGEVLEDTITSSVCSRGKVFRLTFSGQKALKVKEKALAMGLPLLQRKWGH